MFQLAAISLVRLKVQRLRDNFTKNCSDGPGKTDEGIENLIVTNTKDSLLLLANHRASVAP